MMSWAKSKQRSGEHVHKQLRETYSFDVAQLKNFSYTEVSCSAACRGSVHKGKILQDVCRLSVFSPKAAQGDFRKCSQTATENLAKNGFQLKLLRTMLHSYVLVCCVCKRNALTRTNVLSVWPLLHKLTDRGVQKHMPISIATGGTMKRPTYRSTTILTTSELRVLDLVAMVLIGESSVPGKELSESEASSTRSPWPNDDAPNAV